MNLRPMPADFAEVAPTMNRSQLCGHYKTGNNYISRWFKEAGIPPRQHGRPIASGKLRPMPADFPTLAPTMTRADLCRHYHAGNSYITRWLAESGEGPRRPGVKQALRPMPDDFAQVAPTKTLAGLRVHYTSSDTVVKRWLQEANITAKTHTANHLKRGHFCGRVLVKPQADMRPDSMWIRAANVLQRERFVVFKCNARGGADQNGDFWMVGRVVCTPDELLMRAARYERLAA